MTFFIEQFATFIKALQRLPPLHSGCASVYMLQAHGRGWKVDSPEKTQLLTLTGMLPTEMMKTHYAALLRLCGADDHQTHSQADDEQQDMPFSCEQCDASFLTISGLRRHMTRTHQAVAFKPSLVDPELCKLGVGGIPQCPYCSKTFSEWRRFCRHLRDNVCQQAVRHPHHRAEHLPPPGLGGAIGDCQVHEADDQPGPRPLPLRRRHLPQGSAGTSVSDADNMFASASRPEQIRSVFDDDKLCEKIKGDWRSTLDSHPDLLERLLHHCALCNMWCAHTAGASD